MQIVIIVIKTKIFQSVWLYDHIIVQKLITVSLFINIPEAASGMVAGVSVITSFVLSLSFKLACRSKK